jgi:hypothetical protein
MAQLIKADGETSKVLPTSGKFFTLKEMQAFVGGLIEFRYMGDEIMVMNEEGKLIDLPINDEATKTLLESNLISRNDYVVGDVLICKRSEVK